MPLSGTYVLIIISNVNNYISQGEPSLQLHWLVSNGTGGAGMEAVAESAIDDTLRVCVNNNFLRSGTCV